MRNTHLFGAAVAALSLAFLPPAADLLAAHSPVEIAEDVDLRHLSLRRSSPEPDATGPAPRVIRLWFSEVPQEGSTHITLSAADGTEIEIGAAAPEEEDARVFRSELEAPLPAGSYKVDWRTMASDGHVIRGDFSFTVAAD